MTSDEKRCKDECRRQVAVVGSCEMCDCRIGEQHHGLFKSSQRYKLNPLYRYDPDLQFYLCDKCHKYNSSAPHVNNDAFLRNMRAKGGVRAYKAYRIEAVSIGPLIKIDARTVDWKQVYEEMRG